MATVPWPIMFRIESLWEKPRSRQFILCECVRFTGHQPVVWSFIESEPSKLFIGTIDISSSNDKRETPPDQVIFYQIQNLPCSLHFYAIQQHSLADLHSKVEENTEKSDSQINLGK